MMPPKCKVIRDGQLVEIKAELLVLGDIVKIETGDRIPADLRLIMCRGLKVEQSSVTGEAEAVECSVDQ